MTNDGERPPRRRRMLAGLAMLNLGLALAIGARASRAETLPPPVGICQWCGSDSGDFRCCVYLTCGQPGYPACNCGTWNCS